MLFLLAVCLSIGFVTKLNMQFYGSAFYIGTLFGEDLHMRSIPSRYHMYDFA